MHLLHPSASTFDTPTMFSHSGFNDQIQTFLPSDALGQSSLLALENLETKYPIVPLGKCIYNNGLLYINKLLYILDNELLQAKVFNLYYEVPTTGQSS